MLQKKMKKKSEIRNGVYFRPLVPMVGRTICSSTNSTDISARFWAPVGTICRWLPRMKISMVRATARK
jgi:hypothetical protein